MVIFTELMTRYMLQPSHYSINVFLRGQRMNSHEEKPSCDPIPESLRITKLTVNGEKSFSGNTKIPWIKEILVELEREYLEIYQNSNENTQSNLSINVSVTRKKDEHFGDHLIVRGEIKGSYQAACVRCLDATTQNIDQAFSAFFMNTDFEKAQIYEEEIEIFCAEEYMDLHFYSSGMINLNDLVREQVFLNISHFPLHDEKCKGLCPTCGTNLNTTTCSCQHPSN